jgi:hypothetical protein
VVLPQSGFSRSIPKGTFKVRTSKRRIFSQFQVFRFGVRRIQASCFSQAEGHTAARYNELPAKSIVIPNRAESPVRNLLFGLV